jgi:hypothetical protein
MRRPLPSARTAPSHEAERGEGEPLRQDERVELPGSRSHREADPELPPAEADRVGQEAVEPDRGEDEREDRERREERRLESLGPERGRDDASHRLDLRHGQVRVELPDRRPERGAEARRLDGGLQRDADVPRDAPDLRDRLGEGQVDLGLHLGAEAGGGHVADDPDDLERRLLRLRLDDRQGLAERVPFAEESPGGRLVEGGHARRARAVGRGERAPAEHGIPRVSKYAGVTIMTTAPSGSAPGGCHGPPARIRRISSRIGSEFTRAADRTPGNAPVRSRRRS